VHTYWSSEFCVALRVNSRPGGRSPGGIASSNPAGGVDVCCECRVLSGRGLCDGPITRPAESYRTWCLNVVSKPHDEDTVAHEGRRTMFQKNNYKYIMYRNDLRHRSPTPGPWPHLQTMYVLQKLLIIQMVRYTTYCYFFTCGP
jgi:hypothetical protein